jgi:parallel beta-helix repeat protein
MKTKWMLCVTIIFFVCSLCSAEVCGKLAQVSAGEDHSLAITTDGSLLACGSNAHWVLGIGSDTSSFYTLQDVNGIGGVGHLENVAVFDAGWYHSLSADVNGTLVSWGWDTQGQLGNGGLGRTDSNVPQKVKGLNDIGYLSDSFKIVAVSAGRSGLHSLVVDSNGYAYAFGLNDSGQCGNNNTINRQYPVLVWDDDANTTNGYLGDVAKIIAVEAGVTHSLALSDSNSGGYVFEWGGNNGYHYPQKVPNFQGGGGGYLRDINGISTCGHSVAVDSNGFVYEWDYYHHTPAKVPGGQMGTPYLQNIKMVAAGYYDGGSRSMALGNDGRVWIWSFGGNPSLVACGQMNTQSGYLENIKSIAFGYYDHKLVVDGQGYGWAWGSYNGDGEFGVGDNASYPTPVKMFYPVPDPNVWNINSGKHYTTIQSAINDANTTNNNVLVVGPGVYMENVNLGNNDNNNKLLTLQSSDPNDPLIIAQTIINGSSGGTITFTNNNSVINGFTIVNGYSGVACSGNSSPTIKNCYIRNNVWGLYCGSSSTPTIANCIIKNNSDGGIYGDYAKQIKIVNNWIVNNNAGYGYGIYVENTNQLTIRNNTISRNNYGISRYGDDPNISNCIIWNNVYANLSGTFNDINYCCISGTSVYPGNGNIKSDPCFVDVNAGNYHIKAASLCRNAGDPNRTYDINETDIDGQPRRNGTARTVDIGADEYYGSSDLNGDGQVNFLDYTIFANAWKTQPSDTSKWNPACDFIDDNNVDINDLAWFVQAWYFPPPTEPQASAPGPFEEPPPPPPPPTPSIYLAYDGSITPDPNTEVTVYVYSDIPLSSMDMVVTVTGDATITTAMGSYDCTDYGWDSEWGWDPYIDNGWVQFGGVSWAGEATGTVGYFKFIYNSGEVAVSITADSYVYDANSQPATFSTDPLIFGGESMQSSQQQYMMQSSSEESAAMDSTEVVDVNELADWLEKIWLEDAEIRATSTQAEWQQFIDNLRSLGSSQ